MADLRANVKLRKANLDDMLKVLTWQNAPGARQFCRQPETISLDDHKVWFEKKLAARSSQVYIMTESGQDVGMLRLDQITPESDQYEVSLIVDQHNKGRGIGKAAVEAAKNLVKSGTILAEVLPANIVSAKLFVALGFKPYEHPDGGQWFYFQTLKA